MQHSVPHRMIDGFLWPCCLIFVVLFLAPFAAGAMADVVVDRNVMVPMRDGVKLATDVYRPADGERPLVGPFPVILTRTPYNKDGNQRYGEYFAARGYVFVAQDTRGRYGSQGVWHWLTDDGPDGADAAQWIAQQSWSNQTIGMLGTSYVGGTQHALAMEGSPYL